MRGKKWFCGALICLIMCAGCVYYTLAHKASTLRSAAHADVGLWPFAGFEKHTEGCFEAATDKQSSENGPCSTEEQMSAYIANEGDGSLWREDLIADDCPRSSSVHRSVISKENAALVRCTSAFSNTVRRGRTPHCGRNNTARPGKSHSPASICVFYLNYRNLDNLVTSVKTHVMRSHKPDLVSHTVLTMDEEASDVDSTRQALRYVADVYRLNFPPGTRGGEPLPIAVRLISLFSSCPLTVVSDSDAFMLADGWDSRLMAQFLDRNLSLFAANPRHNSHGVVFRDVAEWNWMAYRTQAFAGLVIGGDGPVELADVGHYYTQCARHAGTKHVHLQGTMWPYEGKAATVVTNDNGSPWILHLFYASRHNNEPEDIKSEARKYSLTEGQLAELRANLTRTRRLDPGEAFGLEHVE